MARKSVPMNPDPGKRIALYARVSTNKHKCRACRATFKEKEGSITLQCPKCGSVDIERSQNPETQLLPLRSYAKARDAAAVLEYIDRESSGKARPRLEAMLKDSRQRLFDAVVVVRFDRFARSTKELVLALEEFQGLGIDFVSLNESIDTSTAMGKFFFSVVAAFAEFERSIIRERVRAGVDRAREQGKQLGRPKRIVDRERVLQLYSELQSVRKVAKLTGVSKNKVASLVSRVAWVSQNPSLEAPAN
jgi:DNA invertase Pin-like site-specific DNA recombinase